MLHRIFGVAPPRTVKTAFSVTHTSDTALDTRANGGTQIGSTLNDVILPTSGVIRITLLEIEFDETENSASAEVAFALDVGGTKVWAAADAPDGTSNDRIIDLDQNVSSRLVSVGSDGKSANDHTAMIFTYDIIAHGFPTGPQAIQIYFGDNAQSTTGEATVTGTTVTCRILVEVIDTT